MGCLGLQVSDPRRPAGSREISRYDLSEIEWRVIEPPLQSKPRGLSGVDDHPAPKEHSV